jgi:YCII-related domain
LIELFSANKERHTMNESNDQGEANCPESEEQMQRTAFRWVAWLRQLRESGYSNDVGFQALGPTYVVGPNGQVGEANAASKDRGQIWGYIVIEADDLAQAVELASCCPILETGGCVEIRPIAPVDITWN